MTLSPKRRVFVEEYLKCWNATEAARRAQYKHPNVKGPELVKIGKIADVIEQRLKEVQMSTDETLARITEIARVEYSPYIQRDGTIDLSALVDDDKAHLIKGIKETKYGKEITFYDGQKALTDMGRRHGLFKDRTENLNIDVSTLTDAQLNRIANGEDPLIVLADKS
jgi:phage terminase small subunit